MSFCAEPLLVKRGEERGRKGKRGESAPQDCKIISRLALQ